MNKKTKAKCWRAEVLVGRNVGCLAGGRKHSHGMFSNRRASVKQNQYTSFMALNYFPLFYRYSFPDHLRAKSEIPSNLFVFFLCSHYGRDIGEGA